MVQLKTTIRFSALLVLFESPYVALALASNDHSHTAISIQPFYQIWSNTTNFSFYYSLVTTWLNSKTNISFPTSNTYSSSFNSTPNSNHNIKYKQEEYLMCESILESEHHQSKAIRNRTSFQIIIPVTTVNMASLSIWFVLIIFGTYYVWKICTLKKCNCKLCKYYYITCCKLGEGGFGEIYKVKHLSEVYVLKRCKTDNISEADDLLSEAKHLRSLSHKNIVKYHDDFIHFDYQIGKIEPSIYVILIMEYCEGGDWKEWIDKYYYNNKMFSSEEIINILLQLCEGLNYIHQKRIIHRDIKSQNIFFTKNGVLRIGDFGLAKKWNKNKRCNRNMTKVGTDCYMAPEVIKNKNYGSEADIWSLGLVIEEMCTLTFAWQYDNVIAIEAMTDTNFWNAYINDIQNEKENYDFFKIWLKGIWVVEPEVRFSIASWIYKLKKEKKKIQSHRLIKKY